MRKIYSTACQSISTQRVVFVHQAAVEKTGNLVERKQFRELK
jgi:hypothetical protein